MGTSEFFKWLYHLLVQQPPAAPDRAVDCWIRDALIEDALAQPSSGAWDRLRKVINDRKFRKYGMWVLDEPWRDPREITQPPRKRHSKRVGTYTPNHRKEDYSWQQWQVREAVWGNMMPIFPAWVNW